MLRPVVAGTVTAVLIGLIGLFGIALMTETLAGLAQRVAAGTQVLWPLVTVLSVATSSGGGIISPPNGAVARTGKQRGSEYHHAQAETEV